MFTTELILRLRARCPIFEHRIAGTASFEAATERDADIIVPHAYVIPVEETARDVQGGNATAQQMRLTFVVMVVVDNTKDKVDGRGYSATQQLDQIRRQLLNALIGWEPIMWSVPAPKIITGYEDLVPGSRADTLRYRGSSFVKMTDGRLWHQYEWSVDYYDGNCSNAEIERKKFCGVCVDNKTVLIDPAVPNAITAVPTRVYIPNDAITPEIAANLDDENRVPSAYWRWRSATGTLYLKPDVYPPDVQVCAMFDMEVPRYFEILRKIYAEYHPELLDKAGGDKSAVTPEMFNMLADVPADAKVSWCAPEGSKASEPVFSTGVPTITEEPSQ